MSSADIGARSEVRPEQGTGEHGHFGRGAAVAAETPGSGGTRNVLHVLGSREFALFWSGQTISQTGTWMQQFAQGWVVTTLAGSALALASVNFAASIPMLILMPFGGVAADRMERRRILLVTQSVMAVLAVLLGVLIQAHRLRLWHVWLIALLLGLATAYDLPAYQSFYPQLVETEDLPQAIALNQATFHGSRIIGPAIASWFVALWGMAAAFFANGASFLAVIGSLLLIKPRAATAAKPREHAPIYGGGSAVRPGAPKHPGSVRAHRYHHDIRVPERGGPHAVLCEARAPRRADRPRRDNGSFRASARCWARRISSSSHAAFASGGS